MTTTAPQPAVAETGPPRRSWLRTTDHKRIALLTIVTALVLFFAMGSLALLMRAQLARPGQRLMSNATYDEVFTMHGSGMIYLVITPLAIAFGLYLAPLQVGAPAVAAPRLTMLGFWLYFFGALTVISGFATTEGAASDGWTAYTPLSSARFSPGVGSDLWIAGNFASSLGMILMAGTVLWTVLLRRVPGMATRGCQGDHRARRLGPLSGRQGAHSPEATCAEEGAPC